jgi:hypothetical protein
MGFTHYFSHVNDDVCFKTEPPQKWCFFCCSLFKWIYLFIASSELDIIVFPIYFHFFRYLPEIPLPKNSFFHAIECTHSNKANRMAKRQKPVRRFSRVLFVEKNMCWPNDIRKERELFFQKKKNENKTATVILWVYEK